MFKKLLVLLSLFYAALSFAAVDVNTGTAADLDSIKGIGPGMSKRILDERAKGQFKDWGDFIARVKGVGEKNAAKFSTGGMTVNGAAFTGAPAKPAKGKNDKAAGMSGMSGQQGMSGMSGMSGQKGMSGMSGMSGQKGMSGMSGMSGAAK